MILWITKAAEEEYTVFENLFFYLQLTDLKADWECSQSNSCSVTYVTCFESLDVAFAKS